jgi:hypothetical protein
MPPVIIFGKDGCPFTRKACEAYQAQGKEIFYYNLPNYPEKMEEFI